MADAGEAQRTVLLDLPFTGRWLVQNSPARRIPSHGSDQLGARAAIDFVAVDERGRSSGIRDWRTVLATEPPARFVGYGRPILAPVAATVVAVHDGEPDHEARRSQAALAGYLLGQGARLRAGIGAVAGNHVILGLGGAVFVALVHLRVGSLRVAPGDAVLPGDALAECGNSGNSTEPHVHVQAMDSLDLAVARGIPIAFRNFRERQRGKGRAEVRASGIPGDGSVVEPLAGPVQ